MSHPQRPVPQFALAAAGAALCLGALAGCDDSSNRSRNEPSGRQQAGSTPPGRAEPTPPRAPEAARPPATSPGAGPTASRLIGTWTVTQAQGVPPGESNKGDRAETTTYRFEEGGRVTVAGAKQCAYMLEATELKVDCHGKITTGKVEFRGDQMVWTVGANQTITLNKR